MAQERNVHLEEVNPASLQDDCLRFAGQLPGLHVSQLMQVSPSPGFTQEMVDLRWQGDSSRGYSELVLTSLPYSPRAEEDPVPDLCKDIINSMGEPCDIENPLAPEQTLYIADAQPDRPNKYRPQVVAACLRSLVNVGLRVGPGEWPPGVHTTHFTKSSSYLDGMSEFSVSLPTPPGVNVLLAAINLYLARIVAPDELQRHRMIYSLYAANQGLSYNHEYVSREVAISRYTDPTDATQWDHNQYYQDHDTFGPSKDDPTPQWGVVRDWYAGKLSPKEVDFRDKPNLENRERLSFLHPEYVWVD